MKGALNPVNVGIIFLVLILIWAMLPIMQQAVDDTVPSLNETRDQLLIRASPFMLIMVAFTAVFIIGQKSESQEIG